MDRKVLIAVMLAAIVVASSPIRSASTVSSKPVLMVRVCPAGSATPFCDAEGRSHVVKLREFIEIWIFVKNPLNSLETLGTPRDSPHVVRVNTVTVTITGPPGLDCGPLNCNTWIIDPSFQSYRWDPVVYPMETSRVFFLAWNVDPVATAYPGIYTFTHVVNVDFEGQNMDLSDTFKVNMLPT